MVDLDIARLRALLAKATPGPWEDYGGNVVQRDDPYGEVIPDRCPAAWCGASVLSGPDDRALIVAAVNALPALLDLADPETLRFGAWVDGAHHATAADALEALAVVADLLAHLSHARRVTTADAESPFGSGRQLDDQQRASLATLARIAKEAK